VVATTRRQEPDAKKLLWLTFLRAAIVTVLLGSTIAVHFSGSPAPLPAYLYALVATVYLLTLVYIFLLVRRFPYRLQAVLQIGGDVAVYSGLVYMTGGTESAFTFIYSLAIINAAILLYRQGALWTATACTLVFTTLTLLEVTRVLPPFEASLTPPLEVSAATAFNTVFTNGAAFFFVALLSSYLAEQLRAAESALAEAKGGLADLQALSENILRSIADGLCTVAPDGRVDYANAAAREILGREEAALVGRELREIFPDLALELERGDRSPHYREVAVRRPVGEPVTLGLSASELRDRSESPRGWLLVFRDLSRLKDMETRVQRSERLAAIGKLAADMAHEIRNPLASMSGSIELLGREAPLSPENQELMGIILTEADRLNQLLTDFLAYARPAPPVATPLDLAVVVEETLRMLQNVRPMGAGLRLVAEVKGPIPLEADLNQVKQVLWNLLQNALEAMADGGTLTVRAAPAQGGGATVEVADSGEGIAPEDLGRIFDPFFTTKRHGLGLGLATVHRVVEAHGGRVEVDSAPGCGSAFTVHLPPRPGSAPAGAAEIG
jgi:two-component system sensor histidine kinase PilS (NtrC family)